MDGDDDNTMKIMTMMMKVLLLMSELGKLFATDT